MMEKDSIIEKMVQSILEEYGKYSDRNNNIDVNYLAGSLGFNIREMESTSISGTIILNDNLREIVVNNTLTYNEKRYVITYLLSNYLLYFNNDNSFRYDYTINSNSDSNSAYMTRLLLVRDKPFRIFYRELKMQVREELLVGRLMNQFKVPYFVIEERIEDINNSKIKKLSH